MFFVLRDFLEIGSFAKLPELSFKLRSIQWQADRLIVQGRPQHRVGQFDSADSFRRRRKQSLAIQNRIHKILQDRDVLTAVIRKFKHLLCLLRHGVMLRRLPAEIAD